MGVLDHENIFAQNNKTWKYFTTQFYGRLTSFPLDRRLWTLYQNKWVDSCRGSGHTSCQREGEQWAGGGDKRGRAIGLGALNIGVGSKLRVGGYSLQVSARTAACTKNMRSHPLPHPSKACMQCASARSIVPALCTTSHMHKNASVNQVHVSYVQKFQDSTIINRLIDDV